MRERKKQHKILLNIIRISFFAEVTELIGVEAHEKYVSIVSIFIIESIFFNWADSIFFLIKTCILTIPCVQKKITL